MAPAADKGSSEGAFPAAQPRSPSSRCDTQDTPTSLGWTGDPPNQPTATSVPQQQDRDPQPSPPRLELHLLAAASAGSLVGCKLFLHAGSLLHLLGVEGDAAKRAERGRHLEAGLQALAAEPGDTESSAQWPRGWPRPRGREGTREPSLRAGSEGLLGSPKIQGLGEGHATKPLAWCWKRARGGQSRGGPCPRSPASPPALNELEGGARVRPCWSITQSQPRARCERGTRTCHQNIGDSMG